MDICYSQTIDVKLDTTQHQIADYIHLIVKIEQPKDVVMQVPQYDLKYTAFDTITLGKIDTIAQPNGAVFKQNVTLTCYDTGWVNLPKFPCAYERNGLVDTLYTPPLKLYVASVPIDTTRGLKHIKNPLSAKQPLVKWWMIVCVLAIFGLMYYLINYLKPIKISAKQSQKDKQTPLEASIQFLEHLEQENAWRNTDLKSYYTKISISIRAYLSKTLDKRALEMTSTELLDVFEQQAKQPKMVEQLHHLLFLSDMVKFAKAIPDTSEHIKTLHDAKEWLRQAELLLKNKFEQHG